MFPNYRWQLSGRRSVTRARGVVSSLGESINDVTHGGGEGVGKNVTVCDVGEGGRLSNRDVTLQLKKKILWKIFWREFWKKNLKFFFCNRGREVKALWRHFRGGVSINVTICDQEGGGGQILPKKAWRHLWTPPNVIWFSKPFGMVNHFLRHWDLEFLVNSILVINKKHCVS